MYRIPIAIAVCSIFLGACLPQGSGGDSSESVARADGGVEPDADAGVTTCGEEGEQVRYHLLEDDLFERCSVYLGGIHVSDTQLVDMAEFSGLRRIHGRLSMFRNEEMESLRGLESLQRAGSLVLSNALLITDLTGLEGLEQVDEGLSIYGNVGLRRLDGLDNLSTVGELSITRNYDLESLDGLSALERVDGDVVIDVTDKLQRSEIENFLADIVVGGAIEIREP